MNSTSPYSAEVGSSPDSATKSNVLCRGLQPVAPVTPTATPEPLFRQARGESDRAFEAFCAYLELGPKRRYAAAARKVGASLRTVRRWAHDFDWRGRIAAHAAKIAARYTDSEAALHRDELIETAAREKSFRERQYSVAEAILDAAERYLERADIDDLDAISFADACKALDVASRIARQVDSGDEGDSRYSALRQQLESLLDQAYGDDAVSKRDPDIELPRAWREA